MLSRGNAARASAARLLALWIGAVVVAVVLVALRLQGIAERRLADEAGRVARVWAMQVGASVPASPTLFGGYAAPAAVTSLAGLQRAGGVRAFRLWTLDGRAVFESGAGMAGPAAETSAAVHNAATPAAGSTAMSAMRRDAGAAQAVVAVAARAAGSDADAPQRAAPAVTNAPDIALYRRRMATGPRLMLLPDAAQAWVPVRRGERLLGVAQLDIDLSDAAAATARAAAGSATTAIAGMLAVSGLGLLLWRRHSRAESSARAQVAYLDEHDPLTGALNRKSFVAALDGPQLAGGGAVLCLDLDRFREINEWLGRAAGDALLRQVAARLRATVRGVDRVARLGSDEFALLAVGADADAAEALAQRVVDALAQPHRLADRGVQIGASIGIALHAGGTDAATLLRRADLALARAKGDGRGSFRFYESRLDDRLQWSRRLAVELRDALQQRQLALHYQPLHDAVTGAILGYEALARWPHPERGFVLPTEFVALAEQTGLIDELGRWVLDAACDEAARWPAPLRVAVNLSPAQFRRDGEVVRAVAAALDRSGLAPERLELEITESLLMARTEPVLGALHALRGIGVRIAMDDFGTGYSSLAHLWRFPFDKVKLDREFTTHLDAGCERKVGVIVGSVVSMAHALGMRVTAEGVETEAQRAALADHGCDELQGYLLGRPRPAGELRHRADARTARHAAFEAFAPEI